MQEIYIVTRDNEVESDHNWLFTNLQDAKTFCQKHYDGSSYAIKSCTIDAGLTEVEDEPIKAVWMRCFTCKVQNKGDRFYADSIEDVEILLKDFDSPTTNSGFCSVPDHDWRTLFRVYVAEEIPENEALVIAQKKIAEFNRLASQGHSMQQAVKVINEQES